MVIGSAGKSCLEHLSNLGASAIATGEIGVSARFLGSGFAQGRANLSALIFKGGEFHRALHLYAHLAQASDQQAFVLVLRKNNGESKRSQSLSQILDRHARRPGAFHPQVKSRYLMAAVHDGLCESNLLVELERSSLNRQRSRRRAGLGDSVDNP